jgi:hypothetical protein
VLDFYTVQYCVDFMSELGQRFNRTQAAPVDPNYLAHLRGVYTHFLDRIAR